MRLLGKLRPMEGWMGWLLFHCGLILLMISAWMVRYNVITTASATAQLFGGSVIMDESNPWLPDIRIIDGGALGLGFCYAIGLLFVIIQVMFWASDNQLDEQSEIFQIIAKSTLVADVVSAMYALMGGIHAVELWDAGWVTFFLRFAAALFVTFMFLSIGAEWWLALAMESVRVYMRPGISAYGTALKAVLSAIDEGFNWLNKAKNPRIPDNYGRNQRQMGQNPRQTGQSPRQTGHARLQELERRYRPQTSLVEGDDYNDTG